MNREEWAKFLDGREYGNDFTSKEQSDMMADGIIVLCGDSDDRLELYGAVREEFGAWSGTTLYFGVQTNAGRLRLIFLIRFLA